MNRYAFDALGRPEYVALMFDRRGHSIGMRPAAALTPNVFEVKPKSKDINRIVRAMPFIRKFDMKFDSTVRFRDASFEDGVLVLNLRSIAPVVRRGGRKRKAAAGSIRP